MKGFLFAKLYYEAKEYDLAKRCVSSYIDVQARDPKAHRFLGHLFELEGIVDKAVGCYKRSLELNPTQKDLVLKIAELICTIDATDGRAEYWVEKAAKLFPGSPVIYKLKEQLLNTKGETGWNQLFDLLQSELFARPNDVFVNIRLVELFRSSKRLDEAVIHCLKPERRALRTHLDWCSCVVQVLKEYLSSNGASSKSNWRTINKELLLALADLVVVTLSTRDVQESKLALKSFDQALLSMKPHADGTDDLSVTFTEMRGHYYMHTGTQLLKMAQHSEVQWKGSLEPAALCYLLAFQVPWNKPAKGDENSQNILEGLACDRQSQSGHLLLSLSHGKDDFLKDVTETFANVKGQGSLLQMVFGNDLSMNASFLGTDDITNISCQIPDLNELHRYDYGAIRVHNGDLQHLTWLGLQWHFMFSLPNLRKWLKQLFPRLPQETSKLESNNPESLCILDLEVFLLAVIYTSHLQLQNKYTSNDHHQPRCLPMPICKQLFTDKQRAWWNAVYSLIHKTAQPGSSAKLRLVIQHELNTLRALEKHGLQPALLIHWARSLSTTGNSLNSFYDQRDYLVRCIHYWKKVLPLLDVIRQKKSIPEPVDPLFKHFHSKDIKLSDVRDLEDEAGIAFAKMDIFDGKTEDAILALEAIKSVDSYWNLALVYQRKGEDIDNAMSSEEQEEYHNCMQKCKAYLIKILDEVSADPSSAAKLPVHIESVEELLDEVKRNLNEAPESQSPNFRDTQSFMAASGIKHSTPSPSKFARSPIKTPKSSSKTPPRWAEDQKTMIEELVQQVEALKKEVHELRMNNSNANMSSQRWAAEGFTSDAATDGYHLTQGYYDVPLTVNRMATQQHMYAMHTPPVQNTAICGHALRFESPATSILSPQTDEYYNYSLPQNTANPSLPEPGYFTKATQQAKAEFGKNSFVQPIQGEGPKPSPFTAPLQSTPTFKFNSNFKSNDGDFTFSSNQGATPVSTGSDCLLRLLTSDKPTNGQGIKPTTFETGSDSRTMFRFGEKNFLNNVIDGSNQIQDKSSTVFAQGDNPFGFRSHATPANVLETFVKPDHNVSHESDVGSEYVVEEDGPHFEPVVPLPEKIEVKTGEEDEEEMFCNRAKLFRFDTDTKEWKERGVGNVKILRHRVSGKIRLLMRREQVLKICANHYITPDMKLKQLPSSDKSYVWHAYDYADEMPKSEQLAIRFKTSEEASLFKAKFEEAQKSLQAADDNIDVTKPKADKEFTNADVKAPQTLSFGSQFGLKQGEWRCETCLVNNKETSAACVSCQTPRGGGSKKSSSTQNAKTSNPGISSLNISASAFSFSKDTLTNKPLSTDQPIRSKEQWICSKCSTTNDNTNKQCVHCHPPNQSSSGLATSKSITGFNTATSQGASFGLAFVKKAGQWDCDVCLVLNEPSSTRCVACQAPNPVSAQTTATSASSFKFVAPESSSQKDFGGLFAKKEGQWDCNTCLVRNEANVSQCVSCQSPNPQQPTGNATILPSQTSGFTFNKSQNGSLESMFSKKEGQWDCTVCLVRNEASAAMCVACQTTNPNAKSDTAATETKSAFTFGFKGNSESFGPPSTGFKCNFTGKDFKFGTDNKSSFSFKAPNSNEDTKPSKEGFSFSMPFTSTSFKFGTSDSNTAEQVKEATPLLKAALQDTKDATPIETGVQYEENKQKQSGEIFSNTNSFSFADIAKSSDRFAFGIKDPNFKAFSGAGEKLFVSKSDKVDKANTSTEHEPGDEFYKTEDKDDIHFEPIVHLPDKVDLVTGEEDEKVLYYQRVKLYRFDTESSQWKERGVGVLKILKNEVNGKLRILMRREQVLKVCANHWITTTMHLKPLSGSDRAWIWLANDFSDGDAKLEQLAAKFKTPEQAEEFKNKFEECQRLLLDIPLQTPHKLVDTGRTAHLIKKAEEMKTGLKDLKTFLTDHSKPAEGDTSHNTSESLMKKTSEYTEPTYEWDTYDMRARSLEGNLDDSVYASPLADSPEKRNLFRFGETTEGFNFSFQPAPSPAKSPTKLNLSRTSVGTDEESDVTQEEERDGQYFEPVVPLPDLIEVTSGEENEQTLFCHRAKLYRFDKDVNQWKERGIGDLKILQNYDNRAARIVMRRDQVLKLCANHRIIPDIHLEPMKGAERAWVWTAHDFAEGEEKVELFAVRFKHQEIADQFKEIFEEAKSAQSKDNLLPPFSARVTTPKASPCGKAAVTILEETTKERTDLPAVTSPVSGAKCDLASSPEITPKTVVSPPKFVFGSEVVKNIFGTEKKAFTFGNSSGAGTLFGFSFNPSNVQNIEENKQPQPTPGTQETKSCSAPAVTQKSSEQKVLQNPSVSSSTGVSTSSQIPARARSSSSLEAGCTSDVLIVYELTPTAEQRELANQLLLPPTFFCFKSKPGYVSDENDVDDEDFETAVKKLNGRLYEEDKKSKGQGQQQQAKENECKIVFTQEEKAKAESLKLPSTFFCGVTSGTDEDKETAEDYESAVRKVSEESNKTEEVNEAAQIPSSFTTILQAPDSTTGSSQEPVDLSSKTEPAKLASSSQGISFTFGLNTDSGLSFADLATNNGDFAFGSKDEKFQWANTGAAVFSRTAPNQKTEKGGDSDDEVVHSDDVHFEPIVSLPEVEVKSGEEDEEILFKERTKLYRWDRDTNQWKERGVGDIKILYHQERKYYRILMRRDQVLKVCANHVISKDMKLAPLNTSHNSFVWTANDYSDGVANVEQFAARFKTQELADSFQRKFEECQNNLQLSES
uniref:E3 SUMO-protein ligase RanBP2 n=1 Tax=Pyxicephalus adspersus TaxID=30357 RepID=A0AAV3B4U2_PYXAD|nr:TPA: hypothetical protein GDO54_000971 [Pyxicephalus adspersus]